MCGIVISKLRAVFALGLRIFGGRGNPPKIYLAGFWFKEGDHGKLQHKKSTFSNRFPQQGGHIPAHNFKSWGIVKKVWQLCSHAA